MRQEENNRQKQIINNHLVSNDEILILIVKQNCRTENAKKNVTQYSEQT